MKRKRIAIIGSGIAGLSCAYALHGSHDITVYEAEDYIGGHTHTVPVERNGEHADIDTGFIVFNDRTYPNFMGLMQELGVRYQPTEMSFSVRNDAINIEYNGNNINSLFAQRRNLIRPSFWVMIKEILRFNKEVRLASEQKALTIGEFLKENNYSQMFRENYILPMISAIWSMGLEECMAFPLQFFVRFFDNHGLLDITNRPQWYTIVGGSSSYIAPLIENFQDKIHTKSPVSFVERDETQVRVVTDGGITENYDEVILACHGDQALALLKDPTPSEKSVLGSFVTSKNSVILHCDTENFLPRRKLGWASWNYNMTDMANEQTTLTYNMNILQRLDKENVYLVTLNQEIADEFILGKYSYNHPVFSLEAVAAQMRWPEISGKNRTHFCGAYWFNGFHEDGVRSGFRVAETIKGQS